MRLDLDLYRKIIDTLPTKVSPEVLFFAMWENRCNPQGFFSTTPAWIRLLEGFSSSAGVSIVSHSIPPGILDMLLTPGLGLLCFWKATLKCPGLLENPITLSGTRMEAIKQVILNLDLHTPFVLPPSPEFLHTSAFGSPISLEFCKSLCNIRRDILSNRNGFHQWP